MTLLGKRLQQLRKSKDITQKNLAIILGIKERSYQNYELDSSTPNVAGLIVLADYFDVSTDYLLGRTDNPDSHKMMKEGN